MGKRLGEALLLAESAAFGVGSIWFCYELMTAKSEHLVAAIFELTMLLLIGATLFLAARRISIGRFSGRTPSLIINLISVPIAYNLIQAGRWLIGLPLAAVAVTAIIFLFPNEK